jgi:hypothetical protein
LTIALRVGSQTSAVLRPGREVVEEVVEGENKRK